MTDGEGRRISSGKISVIEHAVDGAQVNGHAVSGAPVNGHVVSGTPVSEHAVNGVPVLRTSQSPLDAAAEPAGQSTNRGVLRDRPTQLRLLAWSAFGVGCLLLARWLLPERRSPFEAPLGLAGWLAVTCGITGFWLVPGQWLSAVMMRTGAGPAAWLATRIGTTLAWYVLVGPVLHKSAESALVTTGGIIGATAAATAAVCLGVALGLLRRPADPRLRLLLAAVAGGVCAQSVIALSMWVWTDGVNYEHVRRLDWLIVLACAFLSAAGMHSRPELPSQRTAGHMHEILVVLAVIAITAVVLVTVGSKWSPAQRMPSAYGAEQVPGPAGVDVAFVLTAIGPEGSGVIRRALFTASDDTGHPVIVRNLLVGDPTADRVALLVVVDPSSRPVLCGRAASQQSNQVKLTMRDQASGVLVQAILPARSCAR